MIFGPPSIVYFYYFKVMSLSIISIIKCHIYVLRNNNRVYWNEIVKIRKSTTQLPSIMDDCDDDTYIVSLFKTTYSDLYNSVSTPVHMVDSLYSTSINSFLIVMKHVSHILQIVTYALQ